VTSHWKIAAAIFAPAVAVAVFEPAVKTELEGGDHPPSSGTIQSRLFLIACRDSVIGNPARVVVSLPALAFLPAASSHFQTLRREKPAYGRG
jgi:hypothetical protein